MASSTSAPGTITTDSPHSKLLAAVLYFLIRRRIFLTFALFAVLIGVDMARGVLPHDVTNFRDPVTAVGIALVLVGLAIRSWAAGVLLKDRELATTGPYRLVRNPLYLGSFLMMFGFCALLNDPLNAAIVLVPLVVMYAMKVRSEERWLAKLFPAAWDEYSSQTRRFIPRLARTDVTASWRIGQWMRSREYQAVAATAAGLVALKFWYASG